MSPYHVALGLADAMLAGPPTPRSARARCASVLGEEPPWLRPLVATIVRRFSNVWHAGMREAIAHAICDSQVFFESLASLSPPVLRRYVLDALRMQPRPLALEACALPNLPTVGHIADWLRLDVGDLRWLADARGWEARAADDRLRHYVYRWMPKRTGGHRLIEIPKPALRAIQRRIVHELLDYLPPHESAHGFRARHSCLTNAREHIGQEVVVRVDLEDFFTSIGGARVLALFRTLGYPDGAARVLTGLCTNSAPRAMLSPKDPSKYDFELPRPDWLARKRYEAPHLPQGAPTSPALANLCAFNFDIRLKAAAEVAGARYTRYADDLTFSGGKRFARRVHRFVALVGAIALEEGFSVNFRKTRVMRRSARQRVTGIVVNEKVNVAREDYDRLKATLHNCALLGPVSQNRAAHGDYRAHLSGRIAHVAALNAQRGRRLQELFDRITW